MKAIIRAAGLGLLAACASNGSPTSDDAPGLLDSTADTSSSENSDTGDPAIEPAAWYGLEGKLSFDDAGERTTVALTVHFYTAEETNEPLCSATLEPTLLEPHKATPDPSVYYWASTAVLETVGTSSCQDGERLPQGAIQLGIGELHDVLLPILAEKGLSHLADSEGVFGSYLGFNTEAPTEEVPGTALVLGYATGESGEANSLEDLLAAELQLQGIFLFPLQSLQLDTGTPSTQ